MKLVAIGANTQSVKKWNPKTEAPDDEFVYIDIASVSQERKQVNGVSRLLGSDAPSRARQLVRAGDVVVSTVRPNLNAVAYIPEELDGATASTGFSVLRTDPNQLDPRYLYHWVRSQEFVSNMVKQATGQSYPAVSDKIVKHSEIPLPPLDEQKRIAAILDQGDALRRLRQRAINRLNTLGQAIFHEMFGDAISTSKLKDAPTVGDALDAGLLVSIQDGNHGERHPKVEDFSDAGTPFIMANCFSIGALNINRAYRLSDHWLSYLRKGFSRPGDVLLTHKGTVGETAIVPDDYDQLILSPQVTFYRPSADVLPEYLQLFFQTAVFQAILKKGADQSTRAYIGLNRQKELPLLIPSMEAQQELVSRVHSINPLRRKQVEGQRTTEALFLSVQNHAFKGEL